MTKRPSLSPETVVRKSRLATKGEAVPALVLERLSPLTSTSEPTVQAAVAETVVEALPTPVAAAPQISPAVVENLMVTLAERDRQIEALRAETERAAEHWSRERSQLMSERDRLANDLAAADATVDELRNRVSDLRGELERSRKDMSLVMQQQAVERQHLLAHHRQEIERLMVLLGRPPADADVSTEAPTGDAETIPKLRRWLFGGNSPKPDPKDLLPSTKMLNRRPVG